MIIRGRETARPRRLLFLIGTLFTLGLLSLGAANYAQLSPEKGVEAGRFTVNGVETVQLRIWASLLEGIPIKVTIGSNEITFTWTEEAARQGFLDTGHLEIAGSEVLVQVQEVGPPNECRIPLSEVPHGSYKAFCADTRAPVTRASVSPEPNEHGWNNTDVTVTLRAQEEEGGSGVREICYRLSGAMSRSLTCRQGDRISFTIRTEGTTTVRYFARDRIGNQEEEKRLEVRIDKTNPRITAIPSPRPNANGWNNIDVTVTFRCEDELSGIERCSDAVKISTEGHHLVTGEAVDRAGNVTQQTVNVTLDKTAPIPRLQLSTTEGAEITLSWRFEDALSGIDPTSCRLFLSGPGFDDRLFSRECEGQQTFKASAQGTGTFTVRAVARDQAGNEGEDSVGFELIEPRQGILVIDNNCGWASKALKVLGFTFTEVDQAEFARMSASDLSRFKLIMVGWSGDCDSPDVSGLRDNRAALAEAINGRVVLSFQDPDWHAVDDDESNDRKHAQKLLRNMIDWVSQGSGTGLIMLADPVGKWDWTPWAGTLAGHVNREAEEDVHILVDHPVYSGLRDEDVSNWGNSRHGYLDIDFSGFTTVATASDPGKRVTLVKAP